MSEENKKFEIGAEELENVSGGFGTDSTSDDTESSLPDWSKIGNGFTPGYIKGVQGANACYITTLGKPDYAKD
jgi:hypothetical protein